MKKLINGTLIILIFFPMLIYLNPFTWGMRRMPHYEPTSKTTNLLSNLNKKYKIKMEVGVVIDTLWYFRDLKNNKISKLENFELNIIDENYQNTNLGNVRNYVKEFNANFDHKRYFDSVKVIINYNIVIYKTKIK